jgi:hypothetical protein
VLIVLKGAEASRFLSHEVVMLAPWIFKGVVVLSREDVDSCGAELSLVSA